MRTRVSLFYSAQNLSQSRFTCLGKNKSNLVLILPSLEKKHRGSNGVIKGFRKMKIILPVRALTILLHYLVQISEK